MIEKGEELWLMLISHIISKRNDSANITLLCTVDDRVFYLKFVTIRVSKYFKASCKIKQSVND